MKSSKLIKYLFILPRTKYVCSFTINNESNPHSMKYDDMYEYIIALVPTKSQEVNEYLRVYHKYFFVDVVKQEIKDLTFDSNKEIQELKKEIRNYSITDVVRKIKEKKIKKTLKKENKQNDSFFKIFSKSKNF